MMLVSRHLRVPLLLVAGLLLQGSTCEPDDTASLGLYGHETVPRDACYSSSAPCALAVGASLKLYVYYGKDDIRAFTPPSVAITPSGVVSYNAATGQITGLGPGIATLAAKAPNGIDTSVKVTVAAVTSTRILPAPLTPERLNGTSAWPGSGGIALLQGSTVLFFAQHRGAGNAVLWGLGRETWSVTGDAGATLASSGDQGEYRTLTGYASGASLTVSAGPGIDLGVKAVATSEVFAMELVDLEGKLATVKQGGTLALKLLSGQSTQVRLHVSATTKDGRYLAGGGYAFFDAKLKTGSQNPGAEGKPLDLTQDSDQRNLIVQANAAATDTLTIKVGTLTADFPVTAAK